MKANFTAARTAALIIALTTSSVWIATAQADQGWFLGGSLGTGSMDEQFDGLTLDDSSSSFRLFGGWRFGDHIAVEAGYLSFGEFEQSFVVNDTPLSASLDADGFTLAARAGWPVGARFSIEPHAGVFFWDGNADVNGASSADPGDTNLFFGLGVSARLSDQIVLTGDWTQYRLDEESDSITVDVLAVGIRIGLGRGARQ